MRDALYTVRLYFTKLSPPVLHGLIPRIGKKSILAKLAKYGIYEEDVDETNDGCDNYAVWIGKDLLLEIMPIRK
jgi:hypothetical protein